MTDIPQRKSVTHRWWFRALLLALFMLPAITDVPYDPANTTAVIQTVLTEPLVVAIPELLPIAKLLLLGVAVMPLLGVPKAERFVLGYYAIILFVLSVLQNMAHTESWDSSGCWAIPLCNWWSFFGVYSTSSCIALV